jgi:hypothetical protein
MVLKQYIPPSPRRRFRIIFGTDGQPYKKATNALNRDKNISLSIEKNSLKIASSNTGK